MNLRECQYYDHLQGKKHRKCLKRRASGQRQSIHNDKGIEIPYGTAFLIEQEGLYNDAVLRYVYSLYDRAAVRSRL